MANQLISVHKSVHKYGLCKDKKGLRTEWASRQIMELLLRIIVIKDMIINKNDSYLKITETLLKRY